MLPSVNSRIRRITATVSAKPVGVSTCRLIPMSEGMMNGGNPGKFNWRAAVSVKMRSPLPVPSDFAPPETSPGGHTDFAAGTRGPRTRGDDDF